jgi:hypothetical protein
MVNRNIIFENTVNLYVQSDTDGLYIMPWKILHDGYQVTKQETVVSISPDAGIPITHSRFSVGGRIIGCKIYVDREQDWWLWFSRATNNRALPFWVYDPKFKGFMKCYMTEQPNLSPANDSPEGVFVQLNLYAKASAIPVYRFITENTPPNLVVDSDNSFIYDKDEVSY